MDSHIQQNKDILQQMPFRAPAKKPISLFYSNGFQQPNQSFEKNSQSLGEDLLNKRIIDLSVEIKELRRAITGQTEKFEVVSDKIYGLPSDKWILTDSLNIILKISQNKTIALIPDLELYADGRNEIDAVSNLKLELLNLIEDLFEDPDSNLGKDPKSWKATLNKLVRKISDNTTNEINTIEIEDCSFEVAKEKIALYFKEKDGLEISYSELMENLGLDLDLIIDACEELEADGKIGQ